MKNLLTSLIILLGFIFFQTGTFSVEEFGVTVLLAIYLLVLRISIDIQKGVET
jgi:hypothetical protein